MTWKNLRQTWLVAMAAMVLVGCGGTQERRPRAEQPTPSGPSAEGAKYVLDAEPAGAKDVLAARKETKDGDSVVVVGRIGGRKDTIGQRAVFPIVDTSEDYCVEDGCRTPWDYCCTPKERLLNATATVRFETEAGQPIDENPKTLLGIKELDIITVRGKAKRDKAGNFVVLADGLFVREKFVAPKK